MIEKKILFIDDDCTIGDILKDFISNMGYAVKVVNNANEALTILKTENFPLIITDLKMPGIDGVELCKKIRGMNQESVIYALSGQLTVFDLEDLSKIGFDGYLCKPVNFNSFQHAIIGAFDKLQRDDL